MVQSFLPKQLHLYLLHLKDLLCWIHVDACSECEMVYVSKSDLMDK